MNTIAYTMKKTFSGSFNGRLLAVAAGLFAAYSFFIVSTVVQIKNL